MELIKMYRYDCIDKGRGKEGGRGGREWIKVYR